MQYKLHNLHNRLIDTFNINQLNEILEEHFDPIIEISMIK